MLLFCIYFSWETKNNQSSINIYHKFLIKALFELINIQVLANVGVCPPVEAVIPSSNSLIVELEAVLANGPVYSSPVVWLWCSPVEVCPPLGSINPDPGAIDQSITSCEYVPPLGNVPCHEEILLCISDGDKADPCDGKRSGGAGLWSHGMAVVVGVSPVPRLLNKLVTLKCLPVMGPARLANYIKE